MNSHLPNKIIFKEEQRFTQLWIIIPFLIIVLFLTFIIGYGMHRQLVQGTPFGNRPISNGTLIIVGVLMIILIWGIFFLFIDMRLTVSVCENSLVVHFRPIFQKIIDYQQIQSCEAIQYKPIVEFGGWGIRFRKGIIAYTVSGNKVVKLYLKDGKTILIGSHQPEELAAQIINRLKNLS